jgi:hypothetical protein
MKRVQPDFCEQQTLTDRAARQEVRKMLATLTDLEPGACATSFTKSAFSAYPVSDPFLDSAHLES